MMIRTMTVLLAMSVLGCGEGEPDPYDLDFEIPTSEAFPQRLSAYGLYAEPASSLVPAEGTVLYELSSELYTDYAKKQRLLMVPKGTSIARNGETLAYPEGTVMAKTFYYPLDMQAPDAGRRIIETRLLVLADGEWNTATYVWNDEQTEATLLLEGMTTPMAWVDADGVSQSTEYAVPHEGECVTCHQSAGASTFIGPSVANLNRTVVREGVEVNQLTYLASQGLLEPAAWDAMTAVSDYRDETLSLEERTRSYLHINCAHCHNPDGWDEATERELDFRYTTPLARSGIERKADEFPELLEDGEMPYLGTTMPHVEGIRLLLEYAGTVEAPERW